MVNDEVAAMLVVHADDIKIAGTKEMTDSVVAGLRKRLPSQHLVEVTRYMGSKYKKSRKGNAGDCANSVYSGCCRTLWYHKDDPNPRLTVVEP